ncbi:MAG: hypothetical protein KME12_11660 [Trichocoleus desertorum ATA4-8-CV12]|jgi:hypothetical protein|nr:hypothetical protein [Trichocoleus desertorum ATA4-8-CV12]
MSRLERSATECSSTQVETKQSVTALQTKGVGDRHPLHKKLVSTARNQRMQLHMPGAATKHPL